MRTIQSKKILIFAPSNEIAMSRTLLLSALLMLIAFILLGVKVLFVKGGRFPSGHVHDIPALRRRNITCAHQSQPNENGTPRHRKQE